MSLRVKLPSASVNVLVEAAPGAALHQAHENATLSGTDQAIHQHGHKHTRVTKAYVTITRSKHTQAANKQTFRPQAASNRAGAYHGLEVDALVAVEHQHLATQGRTQSLHTLRLARARGAIRVACTPSTIGTHREGANTAFMHGHVREPQCFISTVQPSE